MIFGVLHFFSAWNSITQLYVCPLVQTEVDVFEGIRNAG